MIEQIIVIFSFHSRSVKINFKGEHFFNTFISSQSVKTVSVQIRNIYLYKEGPHSVRNKGDLDSGIKTKTQNLALKCNSNMLYSAQLKFTWLNRLDL